MNENSNLFEASEAKILPLCYLFQATIPRFPASISPENPSSCSLMRPVADHPSTELHKKSKTPLLLGRKSSFSSLQAYFSVHRPRKWLFFSIILLQILVLFVARSLPISISSLRIRQRVGTAFAPPALEVSGDPECAFGKVYVYDLPPVFNQEIVKNCDKLNPWSSRCDSLSNDGFGLRAAELAGLVPEELMPAWYWTDQFVTEIIFHDRILGHQCRTFEPEFATAYYIPFYAGLAVGKYLWSNYSHKERDWHGEMMLTWLREQRYWNKSNGWDHFMTLGRITWDFRRTKDEDWGSSFIYMPLMRNITRLLIERNPWDYFDIGIPYPTGFHPRTDADVLHWQRHLRTRNRTTLFSFAGATRGKFSDDFRGLLLSHCLNESDSCRVVDCAGTRCSNGTSAILESFMDSDFCLQPRGDSFTRRSIFDCMVAGSIPVFFWRRTAYFQYEWFLPSEPASYSVFIDRSEVKKGKSVRGVLESYSEEEVRKMREKVIEQIPSLVYARASEGEKGFKDAFDIAIDGVLRRMTVQEKGYKW